ncbi:protein of unknown function [Magnetospirillum gryphiswaldense MSR-1 v2]|uniref:Uncharacterized protein n=1 Tax=Magnetospirillum gryphiswaldense (strain DSM 6361 / JCM 21280 / NBRC 15271 / MSR-1) TaxID=431944 RepID=V6F092_MAGGM|nr:protein of unknown function [Magnetospirillum gryphiswaldense MSR-1 v2]
MSPWYGWYRGGSHKPGYRGATTQPESSKGALSLDKRAFRGGNWYGVVALIFRLSLAKFGAVAPRIANVPGRTRDIRATPPWFVLIFRPTGAADHHVIVFAAPLEHVQLLPQFALSGRVGKCLVFRFTASYEHQALAAGRCSWGCACR